MPQVGEDQSYWEYGHEWPKIGRAFSGKADEPTEPRLSSPQEEVSVR